jgi:hypothetical protein
MGVLLGKAYGFKRFGSFGVAGHLNDRWAALSSSSTISTFSSAIVNAVTS